MEIFQAYAFVRNSSLVEYSRAYNVTGLKFATEAADYILLRKCVMVGEHSVC